METLPVQPRQFFKCTISCAPLHNKQCALPASRYPGRFPFSIDFKRLFSAYAVGTKPAGLSVIYTIPRAPNFFHLEVPLSGSQIALHLTLLAALVVLVRRFLEQRIRPTPVFLAAKVKKFGDAATLRKKTLMERLREWSFPNLPMV